MPNMSEHAKHVRTCQTCPNMPNMSEHAKHVRTCQTCSNMPKVDIPPHAGHISADGGSAALGDDAQRTPIHALAASRVCDVRAGGYSPGPGCSTAVSTGV